MVALSGQVPTHAVGTDAFQECASVDLTRPCTKWSYQVRSVEEIRSVMREAFVVANTGKKGPVHIDLPKDVMVSLLSGEELPVSEHPPRKPVDTTNVADIARLMNGAERPILYVGQGAIDCPDTLRAFALASNIPVTTTLHGMGIFDEHHPLSLHMLGMHGAAYANYAIQNADLILAVGSRFDDRTTGVLPKYAPAAKQAEREGRGGIIHFDIERGQIGRVVQPTYAIEGDCQLSMEALMPLLQSKPRAPWLQQLSAWKSAHPFAYTKAAGGALKTQQVIEAMYRATKGPLQEKILISTGVGNHQMMVRAAARSARARLRASAHGPPPLSNPTLSRGACVPPGGAVLPLVAAALDHHVGLAGHDGLRAARGDRRAVLAPRLDRRAHRRRLVLQHDAQRPGDRR